MTTQLPTTVNMIKIFKAFSPAAFARAARCTNAAAFVHKTLESSKLESLGTRLSEMFCKVSLSSPNANSILLFAFNFSLSTFHSILTTNS